MENFMKLADLVGKSWDTQEALLWHLEGLGFIFPLGPGDEGFDADILGADGRWMKFSVSHSPLIEWWNEDRRAERITVNSFTFYGYE